MVKTTTIHRRLLVAFNMKKIIALILLSATSALAQLQTLDSTTPHTNSYTTSAQITVPGKGWTNEPYSTTNYVSVTYGDPWSTAASKLNSMLSYLFNRLGTNAPFGFTNTTTLAAGSSATVTNVGTVNGIAYFQLGIPQGLPGTNTVTAYVFTNSVLSSSSYVLTNINPLYCNGSNFIGSFSQLYKYSLVLPNTGSGLSPGVNLVESLIISTNGGTSWFTNDATTVAIWTNVLVSVVGDNNTNYAGAITLYGLDHPEVYGRTNTSEGQYWTFDDPVNDQNPVTLAYLKTYIANATGLSWQLIGNHYVYAPYGQTNIDMAISMAGGGWITSIKPVSTNWVLTATNIIPGYQLQISTNLSLTYGWSSPGTYTTTTNLYSATNQWTFTIPKANIPASYAFFRLATFKSVSTTIYPPLVLKSATVWTSNAWSDALSVITNYPDRSFGVASSNGVPVKWFWSNSVVVTSPWMP
jgi:hypothetical protein